MKIVIRWVLALVLITVAAVPAYAAEGAMLHNNSDAWAWVTEYGRNGQQMRAYCVAPHTEHIVGAPFGGLSLSPVPAVPIAAKPYDVRVEVKQKDCGGHLMLDRTLGYDGKTPYYVTGSNGKYRFWHTP